MQYDTLKKVARVHRICPLTFPPLISKINEFLCSSTHYNLKTTLPNTDLTNNAAKNEIIKILHMHQT